MKWPRLKPDESYENSKWKEEALQHGYYKAYRRGAGEYLYRQGDLAQHVILITKGFVARVCGDSLIPNKGEVMVDIHGEGELIGISAACSDDGTDYSDSARTNSENACAIVFSAEWVREHEANRPSAVRSALQRDIQQCVAMVLHSEPAWRTMMKFASVETRLRALLIELAHRFGKINGAMGGVTIDIGLNQQDLADLVGISREHMSRISTALRGKGLLKIENRVIVIPDMERLEKAA